MIIRRRHTANYTTIGNVLFEDERLAADEVGVLAYLLSRPHDWEVRRPALSRRWRMGREAIKRVMTNLVRYGWCRPERTRLPNGTYYMIYEIRDEPGPTLTDEDVRRALSLVSSEAASDEFEVTTPASDVPETGQPPTGYPSLADPALADPYVANIIEQNTELPRTDSTQKIERERERAREKHASNLAEFKRRWPNIANDDQVRLDNAWFALDPGEGDAALAGIAAFADSMKKAGRHMPASFTYLAQKRWTLLTVAEGQASGQSIYPASSREAKALGVFYDVAGKAELFRRTVLRGATMYFSKPFTPQLLALADAPPRGEWTMLNRQQAAAWDHFIRAPEILHNRLPLRENASAPWPWPPRKDGTLSPTGPPDTLMTEQDFNDLT